MNYKYVCIFSLAEYLIMSDKESKEEVIDRLRTRLRHKQDERTHACKLTSRQIARRKNATKCDRAIEFGWTHYDNEEGKYKSVRLANLGGVRSLRVLKSATRQDLLKKGKELFYADGKSIYGDTLETTFDLALDVKGNNRIPKDETIDQLCQRMALKKIRVYLM